MCITDTTSKEKKRMDAVRKRETGVIFGVKGADSDISRSQKYITVEIPTTLLLDTVTDLRKKW